MPTRRAPRKTAATAEPTKPGFIDLTNPTLVERPPTGELWAHEIKWDGYRLQGHSDHGAPTLFTRQGNDWTGRLLPIAAAITKLGARSVILDGEAVALDREGRADFHAMRRGDASLHYKAFDLLWLNGEDQRPLPWRERKARLHDLITRAGPGAAAISYVEAVETDGARVLESACRLGLEGVVSKRVDARYRGGRSTDWLKAKCEVTEATIVLGFTASKGGRITGLFLARAKGGSLVYAGKVERGLTWPDVRQLEARLRPLVIARSAIPVPVARTAGTWVKPEVVVDVSFPNATAAGRMRHPKFVSVRDLER